MYLKLRLPTIASEFASHFRFRVEIRDLIRVQSQKSVAVTFLYTQAKLVQGRFIGCRPPRRLNV